MQSQFNRLSLLLACLLFSASIGRADTAATQPSPSKPTPDQQAVIDADNKAAADAAEVKTDTNLKLKDGSPNPNFGKPNATFMKMHESFLARAKQGPIGVLFLGDSITQGWSSHGLQVWHEHYDKYQPANFGVSGDRTQHVIWRIENGELDGISPKVVVLMIGTNNVGHWSAEDILRGDTKIVDEIHQKLPDTKLLLLAIFPRGSDPKIPAYAAARAKIKEVNQGLAKLDDGNKTRYLDIGEKFLDADGTLPKSVMPDGLHPNEKGYEIWADAMAPTLDEMMK